MAIQITGIVLQILVSFKLCLGMSALDYDRNSQVCEEQAKEPYFDIDTVIGKSWRVYYTWNMDMESKCLDMIVRNASVSTVNRIYNDMHDYLQTQPVWDAATLYISVGPSKYELLMFADQGSEGYFSGVPNVVKSGNITPVRNSVPLLKFFIKLIYEGKYLLMMDCQMGVASLMSKDRLPYRADVHSAAMSLKLGDGLHACLSDKNKDEQYNRKK